MVVSLRVDNRYIDEIKANLLSVTSVPVSFLHRLNALSSLSGSSLRKLSSKSKGVSKGFNETFDSEESNMTYFSSEITLCISKLITDFIAPWSSGNFNFKSATVLL